MILYLDMLSGISGDMCLGALVDLGVDPAWLEARLKPLFDGFRLRTETVFRHHLRATDLFVDVTDDKTHRHYTDIRAIIENSGLSDRVKAGSLTAFEKIARAESVIHGRDIESVHFHEVGGIDSMVDIIGTFICIEHLGITRVHASKVPLGSGFIDCAHGRIPVPVPATLAILEGIPVTGSDATTEIVTPTGAALVATLATSFGPMPEMAMTGTGYGAGKRETGSAAPNLLRAVLGRPVADAAAASAAIQHDRIYTVKTNVDDMNPEILGHVMDLLMEAGALDAAFTPIFMKKNRPATRLEVLCRPHDLDRILELLLTETTAIGVRYHACDRAVLKRETLEMDTSFGSLAVKKVWDAHGSPRILPEYDALRRVARDRQIPLKDVYDRVAGELNPLDTGKGRL